MNNCFLATVYHSGTQYFKRGLELHYRVSVSHFNDRVIAQLPEYETVFTTYRDPLRVAASWANRDRFKSGQHDRWIEQWACYKEAMQFNSIILDVSKGQVQNGIDFGCTAVNSHKDKYGLHQAIDNDDLDKLYEFMPKELIDYSIECSEWAK